MAPSLEFNAAVGTLRYALHLASAGKTEEALPHLHEARAVLVQHPVSPELAETLANIAYVHHRLGNYLEAQPYASAALGMLHKKIFCQRAFLHNMLGNIHQRLENFDTAVEHLRQAAEIYSGTSHTVERVDVYKHLAYNLTKAGRRAEARCVLKEAIEVCTTTDSPSFVHTVAEFYYLLGSSHYNDGEYEQARLNYLVAKNLFSQLCARVNMTRCVEAIAHVSWAESSFDLAAQLFFEAAWDYHEEGNFEESERAAGYHREVVEQIG